MKQNEGIFISGGKYIYYPTAIKSIKKSKDSMQPLYEAFTNSWESIRLLNIEDISQEQIIFRLYFIEEKDLFNTKKTYVLNTFEIEDTGIGLTTDNFDRITRFKDDSKGFNNRGSGRIQFLHFFKESVYESVYKENDFSYRRRLILSNMPKYQSNNAFVLDFGAQELRSKSIDRKTNLELKDAQADKDVKFYNALTALKIKDSFLKHFMMLFCSVESLPKIVIEEFQDNKLVDTQSISKDDIPVIDKSMNFSVFYSEVEPSSKYIKETNDKEDFVVTAFKIPPQGLEKNQVKLTSKRQVLEKPSLKLPFLNSEDTIFNQRYLFLLSSPYLDSEEGDERGVVPLLTASEFKKQGENSLFAEKAILIDSLQDNFNTTVINSYPEIKVKSDDKIKEIEELKQMFLLNEDVLSEVVNSISINDTAEDILNKVYRKQAQNAAKGDAVIKEQIDNLNKLNPIAEDYHESLAKYTDIITKEIPLQNRTALTQYVARRGLVLTLFEKALNRKLDMQSDETGRKKDEEILHNIIFKRGSNDVKGSDIWMINEDYVLYTGASEIKLGNLELNGELILKPDTELTDEQIAHKTSLNLKKYQNRIDTILFPDEGKCIILEYKSPDSLLTDNLTQIRRYATLIYNYCKDEYKFTTFYGYLIGERIDILNLQTDEPDYKEAPGHNKYYYKPHSSVPGFWGKDNGSLYMEIITYRELLGRARNRNGLLFQKLNVDLNQSDDDVPF